MRVLRQIWLAVALWCATPAASLAASRADVVVVYEWAKSAGRTETLYRHGDRTRSDSSAFALRGLQVSVTRYSRDAGDIVADVTRLISGAPVQLSIVGRPGQGPPAHRGAWTGARESHLGESCRVWRGMLGEARDEPWSGCSTPDGVELWLEHSGARRNAMEVRRRPVTASEVTLLASLLDLMAWLDPAVRSRPPAAGYVVELAAPGGLRTIRHAGAWTATSESWRGFRTWQSVSNSADNVRFNAVRDRRGRSLNVSRLPVPPNSDPPSRQTVRASETVRGEACDWWYLPELEGGSAECRAADGAPLKMEFYAMIGGTTHMALDRLQRGPMRLSQLLPGADQVPPAARALARP